MTLRTLVSAEPESNDRYIEVASVLQYWIDAGPKRWFSKDPEFDREFRTRFLEHHLSAAARRLDFWSHTASGALALVILLDQFPRNAFRDTAHMYATDPLARLFAARAIDAGLDCEVDSALRAFFYLPFMHSENIADQERSIELYRNLSGAEYAEQHYTIIQRFGRFPHRNRALGRINTEEEQAFLDAGGFSG